MGAFYTKMPSGLQLFE